MSHLSSLSSLFVTGIELDIDRGVLVGGERIERRLSDLRDCFVDSAAYDRALRHDDPLVYSVSSLEPGSGAGDLHLGLGVLMPGRVGQEFFLTKGHYHSWREAGEFYIGLRGVGGLLLEDEQGTRRFVGLTAGQVVYVPGSTAHRSVNTGDEALVYLGVYPAQAGHDYAAIAADNFAQVVLAGPDGEPEVRDRAVMKRQRGE